MGFLAKIFWTAVYLTALSYAFVEARRGLGLRDSQATSALRDNVAPSRHLSYAAATDTDKEGFLPPSRISRRLGARGNWDSENLTRARLEKRASHTTPGNLKPTPEPTGPPSRSTTVHITDERDFALLLPDRLGELVSDAESDGVAYCTPGSTDSSCDKRVQDGFIRAAAIEKSDDGTYIQVTGCLDASQSSLDPTDTGGQFDVRFPNGAQCTFGGYGASFIQLLEPAADRFCLRCCLSADDQMNCNSHQDREGCMTAIPGTYSFPSLGVACDGE